MNTSNFNFNITPIGKLLNEDRLSVPPNQRSYSWEDKHVLNLLQDIDEAIDNQDQDYFLGTIVLLKSTMNRDLGNSNFDAKRQLLGGSGYLTTKEVSEYETWDMAAIRQRQEALAESAVNTWSLKFGDD